MIRILPTEHDDSDRYLGEMLSLWGLAAWRIGDLPADDTAPSCMIVPRTARTTNIDMRQMLNKQGHVILIAPPEQLLASLDIHYILQYADDGKIEHLRLSHPLLGTFSHHIVPIVGDRMLPFGQHYSAGDFQIPLPKEATVWAHLFNAGEFRQDRPAIWTLPVEGGTITVFNFDLVQAYRDARQGRPRYANWRPDYDDICRPGMLFGPDWCRQAATAGQPVVDFLPMLLVQLIERYASFPYPRFWQLPNAAHSAFLLSGDEDGADPQVNDTILSFMESLGAEMTIYVYMQQCNTTPSDHKRWMARGHRFSAHPYPTWPGLVERSLAPTGDILAGIRRCVEDFRQTFELPTPVIRNHRVFWTGYSDIPRLWESLGVQMDVNYAYDLMDRDVGSYYKVPAASLPVKFLDERYQLISVYQQPVQGADDVDFTPPPKGRLLSADLLAPLAKTLIYNTLIPLGLPFAYIYHPTNFAGFAGPPLRAFLLTAKECGCLMLSDHRWLEFWRARAQWRVDSIRSSSDGASYTLRGPRVEQSLSISFPNVVTSIRINNQQVQPLLRQHFGQERLLVPLPADVEVAQIDVTTH